MHPKLSTGSKRADALARLAFALVLIVALSWALLEAVDALGGADGIRARFGAASILLLVPMFAVPALPGELTTLTTVSIYGFTLGASLAWVGMIMRAWVEYGLSHAMRTAVTEPATSDRLPRWLRRFPVDHPVFLVAGRWMPLGNHVVSVAAGLHGVPPWRFTWTSAVGLVPFVLLVSAGAAGLVAAHG